jgi:hypothetical protein
MPPAGFESTISAAERPQTYALDRVGTGIGPFAFANMKQQMFNCLTKLNAFHPYYSDLLFFNTLT